MTTAPTLAEMEAAANLYEICRCASSREDAEAEIVEFLRRSPAPNTTQPTVTDLEARVAEWMGVDKAHWQRPVVNTHHARLAELSGLPDSLEDQFSEALLDIIAEDRRGTERGYNLAVAMMSSTAEQRLRALCAALDEVKS